MTKRPKLGAVFDSGPGAAVTSAPEAAATPTRDPVQNAPVAEKMVQLNVAVPESLRREVRIKALQQGQDMNTVVKELLTAWVEDLET